MKKEKHSMLLFNIASIVSFCLLITSCSSMTDSPEPHFPTINHPASSASTKTKATGQPVSPASVQAENPAQIIMQNHHQMLTDPAIAVNNLLQILKDIKIHGKTTKGIFFTGDHTLLILSDTEGYLVDLDEAQVVNDLSLPASSVDFRVKPTTNGFALFYLQMRPNSNETVEMQTAENTSAFPAVVCTLFDKKGHLENSFNFNQIADSYNLPSPPIYPMYTDISQDSESFFLCNMDSIWAFNPRQSEISLLASIQQAKPAEVSGMLGFSQIVVTSDNQSIAFLGSSADINGQTENENRSFSTIGLIPLNNTSPVIHPLPHFAINSIMVSPGLIFSKLDFAHISSGTTKSETSILIMKEQNGELIHFPAANAPLEESTHVFSSVQGKFFATLEPLENNILKAVHIYSSEDGSMIKSYILEGEQYGKYHYADNLIILDDLRLCIFTCPISSKSDQEVLYFRF